MRTNSQSSKAGVTERHTVSYLRNGKPEHIAVELPTDSDSDTKEEAAHFVQTLEDNQQIQHEAGPLQPGKTHQIETDLQGNKLLVQKRYSAI
jgi:hypothetical protein